MKKIHALAIIGAVIVMTIGSLAWFKQASASSDCVGEGPCMLYFYADSCAVCKNMEPIVDSLGKKYRGDFSIKRINVDKSQGKKLAREYGIVGQPTYILFDSDGEQVRKLMGAQSAETFEREIERILQQ
jgi:thioredoxin-like negative regulator of GroEL